MLHSKDRDKFGHKRPCFSNTQVVCTCMAFWHSLQGLFKFKLGILGPGLYHPLVYFDMMDVAQRSVAWWNWAQFSCTQSSNPDSSSPCPPEDTGWVRDPTGLSLRVANVPLRFTSLEKWKPSLYACYIWQFKGLFYCLNTEHIPLPGKSSKKKFLFYFTD